jgi:lipoyl(octanoyl) transferase
VIKLHIKHLGLREYVPVWEAMQRFTAQRSNTTTDEFWIVEHPPVFTQGLNGKAEHIVDAGPIPVIRVDRGGQVTYHGPGQVVIYLLLDLRRLALGVRQLVHHIEHAVIESLAHFGIAAHIKLQAPGVYVSGRKIAALGLRIKRGCSYHGLAFNVNMDLTPFNRIHPCGYRDLQVTQLQALGIELDWLTAAKLLSTQLQREFGYTDESGILSPYGTYTIQSSQRRKITGTS